MSEIVRRSGSLLRDTIETAIVPMLAAVLAFTIGSVGGAACSTGLRWYPGAIILIVVGVSAAFFMLRTRKFRLGFYVGALVFITYGGLLFYNSTSGAGCN